MKIGDVRAFVATPQHPELVPYGYAEALREDQEALRIWQWLIRKDELGQDSFLLGPPGCERRRIALGWCELMRKEVEFRGLAKLLEIHIHVEFHVLH